MSLLRNIWKLYKGITLYLPIIIGVIAAYTGIVWPKAGEVIMVLVMIIAMVAIMGISVVIVQRLKPVAWGCPTGLPPLRDGGIYGGAACLAAGV